jgi:hypothetical protein
MGLSVVKRTVCSQLVMTGLCYVAAIYYLA